MQASLSPDCGPDLLASASRVPGLALSLYSDTTSATAYLRGRPLLTLQRKRLSDRTPGAVWTAYDLDGARLFGAATARGAVAQAELMALAADVEAPACVVTLAPDYTPRPLALAIVPHAGGARRGYTLAGVSAGHVFMRIAYLSNPPPTFRRKADLAEWLALVGLAEGDAVACVGGAA